MPIVYDALLKDYLTMKPNSVGLLAIGFTETRQHATRFDRATAAFLVDGLMHETVNKRAADGKGARYQMLQT